MIFGINSLIAIGLSFAYISYNFQYSYPLAGAFFAVLAAYSLLTAARRLTRERKNRTNKNSNN